MIKIKPSDILKGAGTDWMQLKQQVASTEQLADMRKPNPQMPTRTRGGGYRQPGIGEAEMNAFAAQGNGETGLSAVEPTEGQYQKIAEKRAGGLLPEHKKPIDRTQRTAVSVEDVADPVHQSRVNRLAGAIQGSKLGPVDSYDKMLDFLGKQQQADADADSRARRREMFAAIGDGISALSSLYQTTQGAPVTYTPGAGMSEVMRQRYDRMTAQRKADSDKYLNYLKMQHLAEQDKDSQEYRRQMAEYRQQQAEETKRAHEANEQLKREQLEAKKTAEENIKAYRQARLDMMRAKDPGTVEFFKAKAEALANGWPESEANEAGQIAQERYNEAKKETERQKKLADKKAIKAAPNPPKQGRTSRNNSQSNNKKKKQGSLGKAPGGL